MLTKRKRSIVKSFRCRKEKRCTSSRSSCTFMLARCILFICLRESLSLRVAISGDMTFGFRSPVAGQASPSRRSECARRRTQTDCSRTDESKRAQRNAGAFYRFAPITLGRDSAICRRVPSSLPSPSSTRALERACKQLAIHARLRAARFSILRIERRHRKCRQNARRSSASRENPLAVLSCCFGDIESRRT